MGLDFINRIAKTCVAALLASAVIACSLMAQADSDRAAWNAMMVSPIGALVPLARDPLDDDARQPKVWIRYGRWRYDADDAIHNNIGVTVFQPIDLPLPASELALTAGYVSLSCSMCPPWVTGGASVSSTFWQDGEIGERLSSIGIRADVGGAHYRGSSQTSAVSFASTMVVNFGAPMTETWHFSTTLAPGVGMGRIALADGVHHGIRRTLGGALSLIHRSGLALNVGLQKIMIAHGPTEIGAALGWHP